MEKEIPIPDAPRLLPTQHQVEWKKTWLKEFKQAQVDHDGDESKQRAVATRAANRVLNPDDPTSYEEAEALPDWQVVSRVIKNGKLFVVLINSKKFSFEIPAGKSDAGSGKGKDIADMTKNELVAHAASIGIELDPKLNKDEMIARIAVGK
jgi:hypothetical protein